jgi:hypothetical protein
VSGLQQALIASLGGTPTLLNITAGLQGTKTGYVPAAFGTLNSPAAPAKFRGFTIGGVWEDSSNNTLVFLISGAGITQDMLNYVKINNILRFGSAATFTTAGGTNGQWAIPGVTGMTNTLSYDIYAN